MREGGVNKIEENGKDGIIINGGAMEEKNHQPN